MSQYNLLRNTLFAGAPLPISPPLSSASVSCNRLPGKSQVFKSRCQQSSFWRTQLCAFPRAAVISYLGGFRQQKCVVSQFWKPKVQNQGVRQGHTPSSDSSGDFIPCLFQLLEALNICWPVPLASHPLLLCVCGEGGNVICVSPILGISGPCRYSRMISPSEDP